MPNQSPKQVHTIFVRLNQRLQRGDVSLNEYLTTIQRVIMQLSPKESQRYRRAYQKDRYSVGGLKPLPVPKNIRAFYRKTRIYFDPTKQLYYHGQPRKRSQNRLVSYKDLPKIALLAQDFITRRFFQ